MRHFGNTAGAITKPVLTTCLTCVFRPGRDSVTMLLLRSDLDKATAETVNRRRNGCDDHVIVSRASVDEFARGRPVEPGGSGPSRPWPGLWAACRQIILGPAVPASCSGAGFTGPLGCHQR